MRALSTRDIDVSRTKPFTGVHFTTTLLPLYYCFTADLLLLYCRYVIRAKAGTRQATSDASGKVAKSAGSSLRRHNEAMLQVLLLSLLALLVQKYEC